MNINVCKKYEAERNDTVSVRYSDILDYLRESAFYKSLSDEDPEGVIEIPVQCFRQETTINTGYDFYCHLRAFQFWGFETIPTHILDYCSRTKYNVWKGTAKNVLSEDMFDVLAKTFVKELIIDQQGNVRLCDLPLYLLPYWMKHHPPQNYLKALITTEVAASGGLDVLKFLHKHGYRCDTYTCSAAAEGGHLECLQFLHESGCPWNEDTCAKAAENGHFNCLSYAHEHDCPWNGEVTKYLCINSRHCDIELLRYVLQRGCPIHKDACAKVIKADRIDLLMLLHEYNAQWDENTMRTAVYQSNVQCVQYLYEHGCPWGEEVVRTATTVDVLTFLLERDCPYPENLLVCSAIWSPYNIRFMHRLTILQYLIEVQGMYMPEDGSLFRIALTSGDIDCVQYLVDQGCPLRSIQFSTYSSSSYVHADSPIIEDRSPTEYDTQLLLCLQYAVERGLAV